MEYDIEKQKTANDERDLTNQEKIRTFVEKENYKYFGIMEADTIKYPEMKEKLKRVSRENEKNTRNQGL